MKSTELRIGNFIQEKYNPIKYFAPIISINSELVRVASRPDMEFDFTQIEPIPLTEEWLLKFGFEELNGRLIKYATTSFRRLIWNNVGLFLDFSGHGELLNIHYVHQLQNLYFALTEEELKQSNNEFLR